MHSVLLFGQLSFEWFNKDLNILERINFQNGNYEVLVVNKDKSFKVRNKLRFEEVNLNDVLTNYEINVFPKGKIRILTVPGTGQVYEFDISKSLLKRIDKTFYRGYNFKALQFVQNDTLFSLGGTGFWQINNVLSFFNNPTHEWQIIFPKGDRPDGVYLNSSGISDGFVYSIHMNRDLDNKDTNKKSHFYNFDIKSKTWSKIGDLNTTLLSKNDINSFEFQWSSNHMFFLYSREPIFANVLTNKVYQYVGGRTGFLTNKGKIYLSKGFVYTFRNDNRIISSDSIPYDELIRNSVLLGELYSKTPKTQIKNQVLIFVLALFLLFAAIIIYRSVIKSKRKRSASSTQKPPKYFDKMLEAYKVNGADHLLSTDELSKIIECDSMAFDTQRQYRSKFISSINTYAFDNFGISEAFFRVNHESDKRFIQYGVKKELFAQINDILV